MIAFTTLIAIMAIMNSIASREKRDNILRISIPLYWMLVWTYWIIRTVKG